MEEKKSLGSLSPAVYLLLQVWNGVHNNKAMWSWRRKYCQSSADAMKGIIEAAQQAS